MFTRLLKFAAYFLAAVFVFGVVTQILTLRKPIDHVYRQSSDARRREFASILEHSRASPEDAEKLTAAYAESQDNFGRLLTISSRFMAGACTVVVGLLSAVTYLWSRIRMMRAKFPALD